MGCPAHDRSACNLPLQIYCIIAPKPVHLQTCTAPRLICQCSGSRLTAPRPVRFQTSSDRSDTAPSLHQSHTRKHSISGQKQDWTAQRVHSRTVLTPRFYTPPRPHQFPRFSRNNTPYYRVRNSRVAAKPLLQSSRACVWISPSRAMI